MKHLIGAVLKPFAEIMFAFVITIPLWAVRALVFGILLALAVWVISLPAQMPQSPDGTKKSVLSDLRLFAIGVLALQALLYVIF